MISKPPLKGTPLNQPHAGTALEVVVGIDGTETALRAVEWAATEARLRELPLRIVRAAGRQPAGESVERARAIAIQSEPRLLVYTEQIDQPPLDALVRASTKADLLVMGAVGERLHGMAVGPVALAVSACAYCPVAVVRGHTHPPGGGHPVLLGLGDLALDAPAVTVAFDTAQRHQAQLIILHTARHARPATEHTLADELAPWRSCYPAVPVDLRVVDGSAQQRLLRAAAAAALVVVGTYGHSAPARAVLGSTSRALVRQSPCPVVVVHRDTMVDRARPALIWVGGSPERAVPAPPGTGRDTR